MKKHLKTVSVTAAFAGSMILASVADADVIYETGFEPPTYSEGSLPGQDDWSGSSSANVVVGGTDGYPDAPEGDHFVAFSPPGTSAAAGRPIDTEPLTDPFQVSFSMAFDDDMGDGDITWLYILDDAANFGGAIVGFQSGNITARDGDDTMVLASASARTFYRFVLDITPGESTSFYDLTVYDETDTEVASAPDFEVRGSVTEFGALKPLVQTGNDGVTMFLDDIRVIPEPGALALLGLGSLVMLGRRGRA